MKTTLALIVSLAAPAADWTRYRGPNGSGVTDAVGLPSTLAKDSNVVWKSPVLKGNSSPVVAKGRLYLTGHDGDLRLTLCLDAATGRELWRQSVPKSRDDGANPINGPTTPTPATDGDNVYSFFPEFGLASYTSAGRERWRVPLGPFNVVQGVATSPVAADGAVLLFLDQSTDSFLASFDAKSGKQRWRVKRPDGFLGGYSTPVVRKPARGPVEVIVAGAVEVAAYQVRTGEKLWGVEGLTFAPAASPVLDDGSLYMLEPVGENAPPFTGMLKMDKNKDGKLGVDESTDPVVRKLMAAIDRGKGNNDGAVDAEEWNRSLSGGGGGLLAVKLGARGGGDEAVRWRYTKGVPYLSSALLLDGVVYFVRNGGVMTAVDSGKGELLKAGRLGTATGEFYASPVAADGKIFLVDKDGKTAVVKPGPQWELISNGDLDEQTIATPAIAGGRVFIRTLGTLYCFGKAVPVP